MSYEPTNWKSGDTVTSAKLNKIEQGIANAGGGGGGASALVCNVDQTGTLDHTWQEIHDAMPLAYLAGGQGDYYLVTMVGDEGGMYLIVTTSLQGDAIAHSTFLTDSADGYPVFNQG